MFKFLEKGLVKVLTFKLKRDPWAFVFLIPNHPILFEVLLETALVNNSAIKGDWLSYVYEKLPNSFLKRVFIYQIIFHKNDIAFSKELLKMVARDTVKAHRHQLLIHRLEPRLLTDHAMSRHCYDFLDVFLPTIDELEHTVSLKHLDSEYHADLDYILYNSVYLNHTVRALGAGWILDRFGDRLVVTPSSRLLLEKRSLSAGKGTEYIF